MRKYGRSVRCRCAAQTHTHSYESFMTNVARVGLVCLLKMCLNRQPNDVWCVLLSKCQHTHTHTPSKYNTKTHAMQKLVIGCCKTFIAIAGFGVSKLLPSLRLVRCSLFFFSFLPSFYFCT